MMNKALDYNKLLEDQAKGKLRGKILKYPIFAEIKYDGNYVSVKVEGGNTTFITSGNLTYTHSDSAGDIFTTLPDGVYLCERIGTEGKLGDRVNCNLHGPRKAQLSQGHSYVIHDWLPISDWVEGSTILEYKTRIDFLWRTLPGDMLPKGWCIINNKCELDEHLKIVVNLGYEGLMLKQATWKWKRTSSRTIDFCKYKHRRTADLRCIEIVPGEGKYTGQIGALVLSDANGRIVCVGSGLTDVERSKDPKYFIGRIIEIEYEQIIDTYIQPTYIQIREEKHESD